MQQVNRVGTVFKAPTGGIILHAKAVCRTRAFKTHRIFLFWAEKRKVFALRDGGFSRV